VFKLDLMKNISLLHRTSLKRGINLFCDLTFDMALVFGVVRGAWYGWNVEGGGFQLL